MSYAAAIDQLNAMVPELYTGAGQARRKFWLEEIRALLAALGDPQRSFPVCADCGHQRKGIDGGDAGFHSDGGRGAGGALYLAASGAGKRADTDRRGEIADEEFARLYFRVHDAAQQMLLMGGCRSCPATLRF